MRKTIKIENVKRVINDNLLNSSDELKDWRRGQIVLFEQLSMDASAYQGYGYLSSRDMENSTTGTTVGIHDFNEFTKKWNFDNTDDTRIKFS